MDNPYIGCVEVGEKFSVVGVIICIVKTKSHQLKLVYFVVEIDYYNIFSKPNSN